MSRRGAAAIEFALWLPVLAVTLSGMLDLGFALWSRQLAVNAAREGARAASRVTRDLVSNLPPEEADIEEAGVDQATRVLQAQGTACDVGCTVTAEWFTDMATGYEFVTISIDFPFTPPIGLLEGLFDNVHAEFTAMTLNQV